MRSCKRGRGLTDDTQKLKLLLTSHSSFRSRAAASLAPKLLDGPRTPPHPTAHVSPADGLVASQLIATVVVSVAMLLFSVAWCRPFDAAGCCSSKRLGLWGGILMVVYAILQLTAFSLADAVVEAGEHLRAGCAKAFTSSSK